MEEIMYIPISIEDAVSLLVSVPPNDRNLHMPGEPHYQPKELMPYLGYDNRVGWQVIAEWFYLQALAETGIMPEPHAELLTKDTLSNLLRITTTDVTDVERTITKHDVLALLKLMRGALPKELHPYLHCGCTSYDIICTAFALQIRWTFKRVFLPQIERIDGMWREKIKAHAGTLQGMRTHLQRALPGTAGFWLAVLHNRFYRSAFKARALAEEIPGKFTGAVGTSAATRALFEKIDLQDAALRMLGLPSMLSTQITQPESTARFYYELVLMSGVLANLGNDIRHLQMEEVGEVLTASSTSSAMSHKTANPIAAENIEGMHTSVRCEHDKVTQTLISTLQRDLTGSNVMRGFPAILVFVYQQLKTAERIFSSFSIDADRCRKNFETNSRLVVAELLHLSLQKEGVSEAHELVNKQIVPLARASGNDLATEMDAYAAQPGNEELRDAWQEVPDRIKETLRHPETYIGDAVRVANVEALHAC